MGVKGELQTLEEPGNPGQFDSSTYYRAKGIGYRFWCEETVLKKKSEFPVGEWMKKLKKRGVAVLENALPERFAGILSTMFLGEKSLLEEDTRIDFQWSSLLHLLAISGMHLSLLGLGLFKLLRRIRMPIPVAAVTAGIVMGIYSAWTGGSVATLRAYVMFLVVLGAWVLGRSYDCISSLSLSILLLLLSNYGYFYYSGFQMSAAAVVGAGLMYPLMKKYVRKKVQKPVRTFWQKQKRLLMDSFLACTAINLTTLPLVCYYYSEIPVYGIPVNILLLPTVGYLLFDTCAGVLVGMAGSGMCMFISKIILLPAEVLLLIYEKIMNLVRLLPGAMWICGQPKIWQIALYYAGVLTAAIWMQWRITRERRRKEHVEIPKQFVMKTFPAFLLGLSLVLLFIRFPDVFSVTCLDVGQGDSIAIQSKGHAWLVDGGSSSVKNVGKYRILPYLKSQGIQSLDAVIITHPDEDHINGVLEMLEMIDKRETALRIKKLLLPVWMKEDESEKPFVELAEKIRIPIFYLQRGDTFTFQKMKVEVLHPENMDYSGNANEGSVTLGVHFEEVDALLTGDLEKEGEIETIPYLSQYEYLKCGHHGSKYATSDEFLDVVKPLVAVISCGKDNRYGHPHSDTVERLKEAECEMFRTDRQGAVKLKIDGKRITMETYKQNDFEDEK